MIEMLSEQNGLANRDARSRGATMLTHIRWVTRNRAGLNDRQHQTFICLLPGLKISSPKTAYGDPDPPQQQYIRRFRHAFVKLTVRNYARAA